MIRMLDRMLRCWCLPVAVTFAGGCANTSPLPPADQPPDVPPVSTFVIDFSSFLEDGAAKDAPVAQELPREDWLWSAGEVAVWNIVLTVALVVPVAAFVESFNHEPERDGASWVWAYNATVGEEVYSAELRSTLVDGEIEWSMLISQVGGFTNVNWFTGTSNLTGTAGTWMLNRDPDNVTPFLTIDWTRDPGNGTADIRYTNIAEGDPRNGGSIHYGVTGQTPFDAFYEISNTVVDNVIRIEWNLATKDGRVRDADHFGDEEWHCWDEMLLNIDCPAP